MHSFNRTNIFVEHIFNFKLSRCQIYMKDVIKMTVNNFSVYMDTRPSALAYKVSTVHIWFGYLTH